jgi:hypothetical protein
LKNADREEKNPRSYAFISVPNSKGLFGNIAARLALLHLHGSAPEKTAA